MAKPSSAQPSVSFRLPHRADQRRLEQLAALENLSTGKLAQKVLTEYLNDVERDQIRHRLNGLEAEVQHLRRDLAKAAKAILVGISLLDPEVEQPEGQPRLTRQEAIAWVDQNLGSYGG